MTLRCLGNNQRLCLSRKTGQALINLDRLPLPGKNGTAFSRQSQLPFKQAQQDILRGGEAVSLERTDLRSGFVFLAVFDSSEF